MLLLKSYFNSQLKQELQKKKIKSMLPRFRRLSGKRIFIGKGELKHTSSKVIITFYVYNTESMFLSHKIMQLTTGLYNVKRLLKLKKTVTKDSEGNIKISYNRLFSLNEYLCLRQHYEGYLSYIISSVNKQTSHLNVINKYYNSLSSLVEEKLLTNDEVYLIFNNKVKSISTNNYSSFNVYLGIAEEEYKKILDTNVKLLRFNNKKFDANFFYNLLGIVKEIYNKKVEFNIINLKKMHLNSDIFTQAISLKLRNRDNKLYRVLKASLRKIKLPVIRKIDEKQKKPNRDEFFVNRIRNNTISTMLYLKKNKKKIIYNRLEKLLLKFYPSAENLKIKVLKRSSIIKHSISLENYVLTSLKHLKLRGIRVEAKGRLTRRFTASRSVFKMK